MKKIMVRITVPFAVECSSSPGYAGEGDTILDCAIPAKNEAEALRKARERVKIAPPPK